jgi:hypothetical protein
MARNRCLSRIKRPIATAIIVALVAPPLVAMHPDPRTTNAIGPDLYFGRRHTVAPGESPAWRYYGQAAPPAEGDRFKNAKTGDGFSARNQGFDSVQIEELVTPATERVVGSGMGWLAGRQNPDGSSSVRDELILRQSPHGAWPDRVCDEYGTAMALLVLQMPNNLLPIFQR